MRKETTIKKAKRILAERERNIEEHRNQIPPHIVEEGEHQREIQKQLWEMAERSGIKKFKKELGKVIDKKVFWIKKGNKIYLDREELLEKLSEITLEAKE